MTMNVECNIFFKGKVVCFFSGNVSVPYPRYSVLSSLPNHTRLTIRKLKIYLYITSLTLDSVKSRRTGYQNVKFLRRNSSLHIFEAETLWIVSTVCAS